MNFSQREKEIIELMLKKERPMQSQEIADELGISQRTVQREMPLLADELKRYGMLLIRNRRQGNYLSGTPTAKERLREDIPFDGGVDTADKEARRRFLLFNLLREREPRKLYYYSNLLGVSDTTVSADIDALLPWLNRNNLSVIRKQGYGVMLDGKEKDYRQAMRVFIHENIVRGGNDTDRYNDEVLSDILMHSTDEGIYSFLDKDTLERVDLVLEEMDEPRINALAKNAYAGLVTHIAIVIERIRQGAFLEQCVYEISDKENRESYDLAVRILSAMEDEFEIAIPEEEVSYILLHVQGSKLAYSADIENEDDLGVGEEELIDIIDKMVDIYSPKLSVALKGDEDFVRGLIVHLRPVFVRLRSQMDIYNPLLSQIKNEYPDIFERCKSCAAVIEERVSASVSDEEIGFLAMHFGAAEERALSIQSSTRRVNVGVVCASGFGVARLMMTKLERTLGERVSLRAYGQDELKGDVIGSTDFFISTLQLDAKGVDYISVHPLITASELAAIEHKLNDYSHVHRSRNDVDFYDQLERMHCVTQDVLTLIKGVRKYEISAGVTFAELLLFMGLKLTGSTVKAQTVVDDVLEREKLYTQIFEELDFCLLHCMTSAVDEVKLAVCSPIDGGRYEDEYFRGISTAIMLLSPKDDYRRVHAQVLGQISAAIIDNDGFLPVIRCGSEEEIRTQIEKILKKYYINYIDSVRI